jgi:hypothetical protein
MTTRIVLGETVTCKLLDGELVTGIVRHKPVDTGDAWVIETDEAIVYIQQYAIIRKIKREGL